MSSIHFLSLFTCDQEHAPAEVGENHFASMNVCCSASSKAQGESFKASKWGDSIK
jgi:hypothetical protein